ncbi:MAG TPA: NAD(P)H-dependent oxidoreductase subunit E [Thermoanaerobaculia bacterium]|nr:NAD(P)H-dependent oxidoreductase subunit E [Thermoanaerobaculia bacterium]
MADLHPDNPYHPARHPTSPASLEFPPEVKKRFDDLLPRYPTKEAALLPTLHLVQETWGWISPDAVIYVSKLLDLTPAAVFGVVTFYDMYNQRPVGKYFLKVCTNLSCMIRNAYDIFEDLHEKLEMGPDGITPDGKFSLGQVECLGSCDTAPVVLVNNDYHENMSVAKMDQLLSTLK